MRRTIAKNTIVILIGLILLCGLPLLICGCEDKIQVDLKNSEPRLVIEGYLSYWPNDSYFIVSRTTDYYKPTGVMPVSGALILIADSSGEVDTMFEEVSRPGLYKNGRVQGDFKRSYQATVIVDGKTYRATATMPLPKNIDSLRVTFQEGGGIGPEEDKGYRVHVFFRDRKGIHDYARIMLALDNRLYQEFYLYDGKFSDGNVIDYDYFLNVFQIGDSVWAQITSLDKDMYDYFKTLSEVSAQSNGSNTFDVTPSNPNTNWSSGALGYFGAFYRDVDRLVVGDK